MTENRTPVLRLSDSQIAWLRKSFHEHNAATKICRCVGEDESTGGQQ